MSNKSNQTNQTKTTKSANAKAKAPTVKKVLYNNIQKKQVVALAKKYAKSDNDTKAYVLIIDAMRWQAKLAKRDFVLSDIENIKLKANKLSKNAIALRKSASATSFEKSKIVLDELLAK